MADSDSEDYPRRRPDSSDEHSPLLPKTVASKPVVAAKSKPVLAAPVPVKQKQTVSTSVKSLPVAQQPVLAAKSKPVLPTPQAVSAAKSKTVSAVRQKPDPPQAEKPIKFVSMSSENLEGTDSASSTPEKTVVQTKKSKTKPNKIECSSDSEIPAPPPQERKQAVIKVEIPFEFSKGDKLVAVENDYTVKPDDTIIVIRAVKPIKVKLFPIASRQIPKGYNVSKRLIIKSLFPLVSHEIVCGPGNCFDENKTKTVLAISDGSVCRLNAGGNFWYIM